MNLEFSFAYALGEHAIHAPAGLLDESAELEGLGKPAVARGVLPEDAICSDTGREAVGARDGNTVGVLTHMDRTLPRVVTMANCVQERFAPKRIIAAFVIPRPSINSSSFRSCSSVSWTSRVSAG